MISLDLSGRSVLVCGVARGGIGGATARRLAAAGAGVFLVDYKQELIDQTMEDVEAAGGRCEGMIADLTDEAQSDKVVAEAVRRFGRLDGVANVAGGTRAHEWIRLEDTPTSLFRDVLNLNLEYVFRICRDAAAHMIASGVKGSLVNVASISAINSAPFHGPYGAAKAGIAALTRTMAIEWQQHGIRANTVSPGAVATERVMARSSWGTTTSTGGSANGLTQPNEVADTILFLLSDLASGVSGHTLVVDSALTANYPSGGTAKNFLSTLGHYRS